MHAIAISLYAADKIPSSLPATHGLHEPIVDVGGVAVNANVEPRHQRGSKVICNASRRVSGTACLVENGTAGIKDHGSSKRTEVFYEFNQVRVAEWLPSRQNDCLQT
jgi:hypothetical protein